MSRRPLVPEAKKGLEKLRAEYAKEIGGDFKSKAQTPNGSEKLNGFIGGPVGGLMTKKMIESVEKKMADK
ncbi:MULTISPECIES: alpha/beta-type small acid-soluble spore protein [Clostridium]|uniref:alpha/beta-type small acid-soluble spore protein n=1 Tax=Clostridium TaxID=1485 RepID=UPI000824CF91|nr:MULTISPECIES: alpha/beta-type small acid-soluble spore protein [Clostridium]PJI06792.1 acid-soluble spore protein [Clostridium sp. CT7]